MDDDYDAVIVGARCAGATLAIRLARAGWRVALVDRDLFPSDTVSTHVMFPDTLSELESLGVLDRLSAQHELHPVRYSWRVLGQEVAGAFTPIGHHDRCLSIRRITLDFSLLCLAEESGAVPHLGQKAAALVGKGEQDDPVRGVVLADGRRLLAPWVVAADGQRSTVARRLGLATTDQQRGEMAFLLAYWRGLPPSGWCRIDIHEHSGMMSVPVEDGLHLLSVVGPTDLTRGSAGALENRYRRALATFPAVLNPRLLDRAELSGRIVAVPETMMRGYYRPASGPGWVTVGDAGHLKHPSTAQGIGDAVHQSRYVADDLIAGGDLSSYGRWRDERAAAHHEWSFEAARFPRPEAAALYGGLAADRNAGQQFLDTFTRRTSVSAVLTPERTERWRAAAAYEQGVERVTTLVEGLDESQLLRMVPACPDWTVRDLLAHLVGVAEDSARGQFFAGATQAWLDGALAAEREAWTAGHLADRRGQGVARLLADLQRGGSAVVQSLRSGPGPVVAAVAWLDSAPCADLAVHLDDLREALDLSPDSTGLVSSTGFAIYRRWLSSRIAQMGLPALQLIDGVSKWQAGRGAPAASIRADRYDLFRMIAGRRSDAEIRSYEWDGDPDVFVPVLAPYPLPSRDPSSIP